MGNNVAITIGGFQGHFELNVYKPLIANALLQVIFNFCQYVLENFLATYWLQSNLGYVYLSSLSNDTLCFSYSGTSCKCQELRIVFERVSFLPHLCRNYWKYIKSEKYRWQGYVKHDIA
jgi:hypothetical protein